uniref:Type IV pilin protein n=1 Tax=Phormidium sp. KS TaxID=654446 RepID=A0A3G9CMY0_9CYAN|nr:type IV pilin protein [Phormidium sp. KS]
MKYQSSQCDRGFTLVEMLVVIAVIGISASIAAPSFLGFLQRQRLNVAQAQTLDVIRQAQNNAKREKRIWQASFRQDLDRVQWAVHPENLSLDRLDWNDLLGEDADLIEIDPNYTTLLEQDGIYRVQFQYKGRVNGQLGRITLVSRGSANSNHASKRCVWVSTLLGALRTAGNRECVRN